MPPLPPSTPPNEGLNPRPTPQLALAPYLHSSELCVNTEAPRSLSLSLLAKQQDLTPAKARESPQVSWLRKHDPDGLAEAVGNLLVFMAQQFNCVRNLTDFQILLLTQQVVERYWRWHLDEFAYVLNEAVAGTWGKVYDRLDPAIVHDWCTQYETQVQGLVIADKSEGDAASFKAAEADTSAPNDLHRLHWGYLRKKLENETDERLHHVLNECRLHPNAPSAVSNKEVAEEILSERKRVKTAGPTPEEKEAGYQRFRASHYTGKVVEQGPSEPLE
jgi:hypothetical protein